MLQGVFLSAITLLFTFMVAFAFSKSSAFASLIERYSMNAVSFTFWTVCIDFFRNVHVIHYQLCIKETYNLLYLFTYMTKNNDLDNNRYDLPSVPKPDHQHATHRKITNTKPLPLTKTEQKPATKFINSNCNV
jgi:hypothetical protein